MKVTKNTIKCKKQNNGIIINCGNSVKYERHKNGQSDSRMIEKDYINIDKSTVDILERVLSKDNMNDVYQKVKRNKGVGGVKKMEIDELLKFLLGGN